MDAKVELSNRKFLQDLRDAAVNRATDALNGTWERAYLALANAADHLDAMEARTIERAD